MAASYKKIQDVDDGKQANLRVTRDVLWNGAFSESEICAEYFGGIMASSRSEDGKDDAAIQFVDVTKSLSSNQLGLHYVVYNRLNKLWVSSGARVNVGLSEDIAPRQVWFASLELDSELALSVDPDLNILYRHGLLSEYSTNVHMVGSKALPYTSANPTTFGVLLYAFAHNRYGEWHQFDSVDFGDFDGIQLPQYYGESLEALAEITGLTATADAEQSGDATVDNVEEKSDASH